MRIIFGTRRHSVTVLVYWAEGIMYVFRGVIAILLFQAAVGTTETYKDALEQLIESNTKFATNLYKEIIKQSEVTNVVFSPLSVSAALAMVKLGAKGNSTKQIDKALALENIESSLVNSAFGELHALLFDKPISNTTLKGANGAFISKTTTVLNDYKNALSVFGAKIEELDFKDAKGSVAHINKWISEETEDLIPKMLGDDALDSMTALLLASTLYFSGQWHSGFNPVQTEDRAFYISHYRVIHTPFMYQRGKFRFGYVDSLGLQVLEMPYGGQEISMIVLLPDNFELNALEKELSYENLDKWLSTLEYNTVDLTFPKFKIESEHALQKPLQELGVSDIFSSTTADLSGITGDKSLFVDAVLHKGVLEVEPLGGLVRAERDEANRTPAEERKIFYADHPFIFIIKNSKTGSVYLFGAYKRPEGQERHHDEL